MSVKHVALNSIWNFLIAVNQAFVHNAADVP